MEGHVHLRARVTSARIHGIDPDEVACRSTTHARLAAGRSPAGVLRVDFAFDYVGWLFPLRDDQDNRRAQRTKPSGPIHLGWNIGGRFVAACPARWAPHVAVHRLAMLAAIRVRRSPYRKHCHGLMRRTTAQPTQDFRSPPHHCLNLTTIRRLGWIEESGSSARLVECRRMTAWAVPHCASICRQTHEA